MKKLSLYALCCMIFLTFNSCGDNNKGDDVLAINNMLDNNDFDGVINILETDKKTKTKEEKLSLASAYMGKAGLTFASLITMIVPEEEKNSNKTNNKGDGTSSSNDSFAAFIKKLSEKAGPSAILFLKRALGYYKSILKNKTCSNIKLDSDKDLCLKQGVASVAQVGIVINGLTSNISSFGTGITDDQLEASICGLYYVYRDENRSGCTIKEEAEVKFLKTNRVYTPFTVTLENNKRFRYLIDNSKEEKDIPATKGYCTLNSFKSRVNNSDLENGFPCSVIETTDDKDISILVVLVQVLNDGFDSILNLKLDKDLTDKIAKFKAKIVADSSENITKEDILDYLETQN